MSAGGDDVLRSDEWHWVERFASDGHASPAALVIAG